jgi:O-antigen ligase
MGKRDLFLSKIIIAGISFITLGIWTQGVYEPVNLPKMLLLCGFSFAAVGVLGVAGLTQFIKNFRFLAILLFSFAGFGLAVLFLNSSVFSRSLFGTYGRNTGFLTYFCLALFLLVCTQISNPNFSKNLVSVLLVTGTTNCAYGLIQLLGKDFMPWGSQKGTMMGTFGNANFASAFLGIFSTAIFVSLLYKLYSNVIRTSLVMVFVLTLALIVWSNSIQGLVVSLAGCALALLVWMMHKNLKPGYLYTYTLSLISVALLGTAGILGNGPLSKFLFSQNIAYRIEYWKAAFKTGSNNLFLGVGWDSFGDYYRRFRTTKALVSPGVDVTTDAAHNVFLDVFASGGLLLLLSYLGITLLILVSGIRRIKQGGYRDPIYVTIFIAWIGYQLQSLISINQIGLAIWGWALGGTILGYTVHFKIDNSESPVSEKRMTKLNKSASNDFEFYRITAGVLFVGGVLLSLPPIMADASWRNSQESKKYEDIAGSIMKWPREPNRMVTGAKIFTLNKYEAEGLKYTLEATRNFPDSFGPWELLYTIPQSTDEQRAEALKQLRRLDPLNPKLKGL